MFSLPLSLFIFISLLLLHNFIIFPPQCFYFLLYNFYYFPFSTFLFSPPQFYYFPSSFLTSLPHHNINLSPPPPYSFFLFLLNFYYFPPSILISLLLHFHLLIYSMYFSIHRYIDLLSTLRRLHIHPTSTLDSTFFSTQLGKK